MRSLRALAATAPAGAVSGLSEGDRPAGDPAYGWAIVASLGVTEAVGYGVLTYAFSVLLVPMERDLGWSRVALTGAYSLAILVSGLASVSVGRLLDRCSPRLPMTAGSALAAALVFAWSRVSTLPELYLVFLGLGVAMALILYEPAFIVITKWFLFRRYAALTALTMIAAFSSFIFSPLTARLVESWGWRGAVGVLALILAGVTVPIHALVLRPSPRLHQDAAGGTAVAGRRRAVGGDVSFWMIVGAFALGSFTTVSIAVHLVPLMVGAGSSAPVAAFAAGLMGLAQIPGRVLFAVSSSRLGATTNTAAVFGLAGASLVLLIVSQSGWAVLVFVVCFGMCNGMLTLLRATVIGDIYGQAEYGAISGVASACALTACAAAPLAASLIAVAPGGYITLLLVLTGATCLAAVAAARGTRQALASVRHA